MTCSLVMNLVLPSSRSSGADASRSRLTSGRPCVLMSTTVPRSPFHRSASEKFFTQITRSPIVKPSASPDGFRIDFASRFSAWMPPSSAASALPYWGAMMMSRSGSTRPFSSHPRSSVAVVCVPPLSMILNDSPPDSMRSAGASPFRIADAARCTAPCARWHVVRRDTRSGIRSIRSWNGQPCPTGGSCAESPTRISFGGLNSSSLAISGASIMEPSSMMTGEVNGAMRRKIVPS